MVQRSGFVRSGAVCMMRFAAAGASGAGGESARTKAAFTIFRSMRWAAISKRFDVTLAAALETEPEEDRIFRWGKLRADRRSR